MKLALATSALLVSLALFASENPAHAQTAVIETTAAPAPPPGAAAGEWVETSDGWIWIPAGAQTTMNGGTPYVYLYTPTYGWTWYASPWGAGPFVRGAWVSRPWPHGFHVWAHRGGGWGWYHAGRAPVHVGVVVHAGHSGPHHAAPARAHGGYAHGGPSRGGRGAPSHGGGHGGGHHR